MHLTFWNVNINFLQIVIHFILHNQLLSLLVLDKLINLVKNCWLLCVSLLAVTLWRILLLQQLNVGVKLLGSIVWTSLHIRQLMVMLCETSSIMLHIILHSIFQLEMFIKEMGSCQIAGHFWILLLSFYCEFGLLLVI